MSLQKTLTAAAIVLFLIPFSSAHAALPSSLTVGSSGSSVSELQTLLGTLGYFKQQATGYFGQVTKAAVTSYQSGNGMAAVGALTPQTSTNLNAYAAFSNNPSVASSVISSTLTLGSTGSFVTQYQQYLYKLGYLSSAPTGYYGALTQAAVRSFQTFNGIAATGNLDTHTQYLLSLTPNSAQPIAIHTAPPVVTTVPVTTTPVVTTPVVVVPPAPVVAAALPTHAIFFGTTSSDVIALQKWLISKGYSIPAGATGYYGAQTSSAVSAYQRSLGEVATGNYAPASSTVATTGGTTTTTTTTTGTQPTGSTTTTNPTTANAPTVTLSASASSIAAGKTLHLTWDSTNATSCTASGAWSSSIKTSGTKSIEVQDTGISTYGITCVGKGGTASQSAVVTVTKKTSSGGGGGGGGSSGGGSSGGGGGGGGSVLPASAPTLTLTATPSTVDSGNSSTIAWSSTDATSCTASAPGWSITQSTSGSVIVPNITADQSYTLTCTGDGGVVSKSVTVTVNLPQSTPSGGMPIGMNLAGVTYYGGEDAFIDIAHTGGGWSVGNVPVPVDSRGYPTVAGLPPAPASLDYLMNLNNSITAGATSTYVVTWTGSATLIQVSASTITSNTPGRATFVPNVNTSAFIRFRYTSTSTAPVTDVHVFRADQESLFDQGQIFDPSFLNLVSQWKLVRFMDWGDTNTLQPVDWSTRGTDSQLEWGSQMHPGGVPLEVMVDLANAAHVSMWYNVPTEADDTYVTNAMTYIRDHLSSGLTLHVEYSNEVWNTGFRANSYALAQAQTLWGAGSPNANALTYYGYRAAQIAAIAHQVFGSVPTSRLSVVLSDQDGNTYNTPHYYLPGIALANEGTVNQLFAEFAVAPYFGGIFGNTADGPTILQWANEGSVGLDNAFTALRFGTLLSKDYSIGHAIGLATAAVGNAQSIGLTPVTYEGGPSLTYIHYTTADKPTYQIFYQSIMDDPRMATLMTDYLNGLAAAGIQEYNHFNDLGTGNENGFWGVLPTVDTPSSPRYDALKAAAAAGNH